MVITKSSKSKIIKEIKKTCNKTNYFKKQDINSKSSQYVQGWGDKKSNHLGLKSENEKQSSETKLNINFLWCANDY